MILEIFDVGFLNTLKDPLFIFIRSHYTKTGEYGFFGDIEVFCKDSGFEQEFAGNVQTQSFIYCIVLFVIVDLDDNCIRRYFLFG